MSCGEMTKAQPLLNTSNKYHAETLKRLNYNKSRIKPNNTQHYNMMFEACIMLDFYDVLGISNMVEITVFMEIMINRLPGSLEAPSEPSPR